MWSCPKFVLERTNSRPRLESTNCMLLLPFLFLFLVALHKKCFLFLFKYCRGCNDLLLPLSSDLYSGMEGGSLLLRLFKRILSSLTAWQIFLSFYEGLFFMLFPFIILHHICLGTEPCLGTLQFNYLKHIAPAVSAQKRIALYFRSEC